MSTSGFRSWLKNVACLSSLLSITFSCCCCQVKVRDIDYGNVEMTPLKALYPLPASVKCIPPQAKYARLAGIRKKEGMKSYPDLASAFLFNAKKRRRVKKNPLFCFFFFLYIFSFSFSYFQRKLKEIKNIMAGDFLSAKAFCPLRLVISFLATSYRLNMFQLMTATITIMMRTMVAATAKRIKIIYIYIYFFII